MRKPLGAAPGALLVAIALGLTGCGSSSSGSSTGTDAGTTSTSSGSADAGSGSATNPTSRHACTLISPQDASRADGVTYLSSGEFNLGSLCNFKASGDGSDNFSILLKKGAGAADWKLQLSLMTNDAGSPGAKTISGVGDRAAAAGQSFAFQSHGAIVEVMNADYRNGAGKPGDWTRSTALAKTIIAKMG